MMRHKNTDRFVILQRFLGHEVAQGQARSFTRSFNYKWFNYYLHGIELEPYKLNSICKKTLSYFVLNSVRLRNLK